MNFDILNKFPEKFINTIVLTITSKCNLNCYYCFTKNSNFKKQGTISFDRIKQAIDYCIERFIPDNIYWMFMGGEPLLEIDLIEKCIKYINEKTQKRVIAGLVTNGVLLSDTDIRKKIIELDIDITLSFDGCKTVQDSQRSNSFDLVSSSLDWYIENFWKKPIIMTFGKSSIDKLYESIRFLYNKYNKITLSVKLDNTVKWSQEEAEIYFKQLILCAKYFTKRQSIDIIKTSNLFFDLENTKFSQCLAGIDTLALSPKYNNIFNGNMKYFL